MILEEHLATNSWVAKSDGSFNGKRYFQKYKETISQPQDQTFRFLGKRMDFSLNYLHERFLSFFNESGYSRMEGANIVNTNGETLFIGAGLQVFYEQFIKGLSTNEKFVLSQPSLRVNALEKMKDHEGYSTSFVNICTEQANATPDEHAIHLENWFTFLSKIGIYTGHLRLVKDSEWNGGKNLGGESLLIYYGDLQIGDAVFVSGNHPEMGKPFTISDIGFGLERICWATKKTARYFETIGPNYDLITKGVIPLDTLRSLTLMSMCGLSPSNINQGYQFKQFIKRYLQSSNDINPNHLIDYYFNFWSDFIIPKRKKDETRENAVSNIQRQLARDIAHNLGLPNLTRDFSNFDDFLNHCRKNIPTRIPEIEAYLNRINRKVIS